MLAFLLFLASGAMLEQTTIVLGLVPQLSSRQPTCFGRRSSSLAFTNSIRSHSTILQVDSLTFHLLKNAKSSTVLGLECVHVEVNLPIVGSITIVEAGSRAQEILVDLALLLDEERDEDASVTSKKELLSLSKGDPYGTVLWPAASALAKHLILKCDLNDEPFVKNRVVLELGTGTGLVSIAVASLRKREENSSQLVRAVIATYYESVPLELLQYAATNLNPNRICAIQLARFDLCDFKNDTFDALLYQKGFVFANDDRYNSHDSKYKNLSLIEPADVIVVAADIMYEPSTGRAMAVRAVEALSRGFHVVIADSPGRAGRPAFLNEIDLAFVKASAPEFLNHQGSPVRGNRHDLICGKDSQTFTPLENTGVETAEGVQEFSPVLPIAILEMDPKIHRKSLRSRNCSASADV